jgi:hypothetical protein
MTAPLNLTSALYNHFRMWLFGGRLPDAAVLVSRLGDDRDHRFNGIHRCCSNKATGRRDHAIWINPVIFASSLEKTCVTLVHEMTHLWQAEHGKSRSNCVHDDEFKNKMEELGLVDVNLTGAWAGTRVNEVVQPGSAFDRAFRSLPESIRRCWSATADAFAGIEEVTTR